MDSWHCTYCGEQHAPERWGLDPRYPQGKCDGEWRVLIRDQAEAKRLANAGGKYRPKGTPLGGGSAKVRLGVLSPAEQAAATAAASLAAGKDPNHPAGAQ